MRLRQVADSKKPSIGLVADIKDENIFAPLSAPFGGFHYKSERIFISEIVHFLNGLKEYIYVKNLKCVFITLPPLIYQKSFNAKVVNSSLCLDYDLLLPDIVSWVNLEEFTGKISCKMCRINFNKSISYNLTFNIIRNVNEKEAAFKLICENRITRGREIHMTFDELINTNKLWPIDFFLLVIQKVKW